MRVKRSEVLTEILVIEKGHYYYATPTETGHGIYEITNINHKTECVEVKNVRSSEKCWTKSSNIRKEIAENRVVLELLEE